MTEAVYDKVSTRLLCEMLYVNLQKLKYRMETTTQCNSQANTEEHEAFMILLVVLIRDYGQAIRDEKVAVVKTWFNDIVVFTRRFPVSVQGIVHALHYRLNDTPREFEFVASPIMDQAHFDSTIKDIEIDE